MSKSDPRKALGKGLHSLLPGRAAGNSSPAAAAEPAPPPEGSVQFLPIDQLTPNPGQPRRDFDAGALLELTQSVEKDGIIQPLLARKIEPNRYQIIAGERRWRAAKSAGLQTVPAIVRTASDEQALELAIVENIQREDLNPIELAMAFHRMATELELSHEEIGKKTGKQRTTITNAVRLLQLPADLQQLISSNQLSAGHARALLKISDPAAQRSMAHQCVLQGWSVRQIEDFTKSRDDGAAAKPPQKKPAPPVDPNVKFAIEEMERVLGTRVRITRSAANKGQIEIEFYSEDDLNRLYETIITV